MLTDKNAIVTGGTRGIGKAIAEEFCRQGANVIICYKSNSDMAEHLRSELSIFGTDVMTRQCDVTDEKQVKDMVKGAVDALGHIDILVNNAGVTRDKLLMRMTKDDFDFVVDTNLKGAFYFSKQVSAQMVKQKYGRIINISSIAGVKGNPGQVNYSASKAGINGLTLSMSKELGKRGITVNAIAPGFIETDMTNVLEKEYRKKLLDVISVGRFGKPEDVAHIATFLASDAASYITGQIIGVDGGMCI